MDPSTSGLEMGMAGMNLLASNNSSNSNKNSSIKSRSPIPNSGDSVDSIHSIRTASSNPTDNLASGNSMNRPPGITGFSVPPIGKPGHAKSASNSSTAHTVTLTPTSSVDGGPPNDLYNGVGGRGQSSPSADHLPGINTLGSFDTDEMARDGLKGLQALRERAQSSPGPSSSSNSGTNASFATSPREFSATARGFIPQSQQQGRPRLISKDGARSVSLGGSRPPLAGSSGIAPHAVEGMAFQSTGSKSRDASPPPNAGVISRPDTQFSAYGSGTDSIDSSLRRALSNEAVGDYSSYNAHRQGSQGSDHLSNAFGQATLNNQQRGSNPGQIPGLQGQGGLYPNHDGSQPQPGLRSLSGADYYHEANYEAGFIPHRANAGLEGDYAMQQHQDMGYHAHGHHQQYQQRRHQRSMSMQHSSYGDGDSSQLMYGMHHRRGSLGMHAPPVQQRRSSDFGAGIGDNTIYEQRERVGNAGYHRPERLVSPSYVPTNANTEVKTDILVISAALLLLQY